MTGEKGALATKDLIQILERCREREKSQTLFYRRLTAAAETASQGDLVERFNEIQADEQHHLSRLTARVLELGGAPAEPNSGEVYGDEGTEGWEEIARAREAAEVAWYESVLEHDLDSRTRDLLIEILDSERHHRDQLGGKWMSA